MISWDIFKFPSETDERNLTEFDWKQDLNVQNHVCFRADLKNKMASLTKQGCNP